MGKFWKEYPEIRIDIAAAKKLASDISVKNLWNFGEGKTANFSEYRKARLVELHPIDLSIDICPGGTKAQKRQEFVSRSIKQYELSEEERQALGIEADMAKIFLTGIGRRPIIHREARAIALNFPIEFDPGLSSVRFYDAAAVEIDRHVLEKFVPIRLAVDQWHTVVNDSVHLPRVVITCSRFTHDWRKIIESDQL